MCSRMSVEIAHDKLSNRNCFCLETCLLFLSDIFCISRCCLLFRYWQILFYCLKGLSWDRDRLRCSKFTTVQSSRANLHVGWSKKKKCHTFQPPTSSFCPCKDVMYHTCGSNSIFWTVPWPPVTCVVFSFRSSCWILLFCSTWEAGLYTKEY